MSMYLASPQADFLRGRYVAADVDVNELEAHQKGVKGKGLLL
jgi:hypothetical protein